MANPIPPLVCSTPPPIDDFGEISQIDDIVENDFGEYETSSDIECGSFEGPSLPNTPRHININKKIINKECMPNNCSSIIKTQDVSFQAEEISFAVLNESMSIVESNDEVIIDNKAVFFNEKETIENIDNNENLKIKDSSEEIDQQKEHNILNNFECFPEKSESPPSLELTYQVIADENDYFEKQSNNEKESDKESCDDSLELNSDNIPKENTELVFNPVSEENEINIDLDFDDFTNDFNLETSNSLKSIDPSLFTHKNSDKITMENISNDTKIGNINKLSIDDINAKTDRNQDDDLKNNSSIIENFIPQENLVFDADFSQFESFSKINTTTETEFDNVKLKKDETDINQSFSSCNDYFNSFQNFEVTKNVDSTKNNEHKVENESSYNIKPYHMPNETIDNIQVDSKLKNNESEDEFDDDFGEFSDFKVSTIPTTSDSLSKTIVISQKSQNTSTNINDKIESVLNIMFPILGNCETKSNYKNDKLIEELNQKHSITTNLNQIDSANSLDYQWSNSNTRHSLIKSLGIDSRNILFGEKWSCSMPRFASNLGFTPLEPLKPVKIDKQQQSQSNLMLTNTSNTINTNKSNLVPEAEFDWNSSGLINPLDASHAHTLLLDYDLDQLVVVANLDNIKLDSYSSLLYPSSLTSLSSASNSTLISTTAQCTGTTTTTTLTTTTTGSTICSNTIKHFQHRWVKNINNHDNNIIVGTTYDNTTVSNYINLNSHKINNNKNIQNIKFGSNRNYAEIMNEINTKNYTNISINATNATTNKTYGAMFDYSLSSRDKQKYSSEKKQNIEIYTSTNEFSKINSSNESSKIENEPIETAIPTKYEIRAEENSVNDFEYISSLSSRNNENSPTKFTTHAEIKTSELGNDEDVTTKSQISSINAELPTIPDITTTKTISAPSGKEKSPPNINLSLEIDPTIHNSEILQVDNTNNILINGKNNENNNNNSNENYIHEQSNYSNDYINMGPTPTTYVVPLKETHIFTPTKSENPISQSTCGKDFIKNCNENAINQTLSPLGAGIISSVINNSIDFDYETAAAGTIINEKVIKKEYHDIEYDPSKFGLVPIDLNSIENDDMNSIQIKSNDSKSDINPLDVNYINSKLFDKKTCNWTFHLNNLNDDKSTNFGTDKNQQIENKISNSDNKMGTMSSFMFSSDNATTTQTMEQDDAFSKPSNEKSSHLIISNDINQKLYTDLTQTEGSNVFNNIEINNENKNVLSTLTKKNSGSFDDEFTDFQSVLPISEYKNNGITSVLSSSDYSIKQQDKFLDSNTILCNKIFKENNSRNQTPTLLSDDRMILSPAILLPQAVSVIEPSISSNKTLKIDWPEPGIDNSEELARLESIFPQANIKINENSVNKDNFNVSNTDDDWSDFISVPPLQQQQQSPKTVNNISNLNIIYNPQSPTKVSSQHNNINHLNKNNDCDDDEWCDFISSAPISSKYNTNINSGNNIQNLNHNIHSGTDFNNLQKNYSTIPNTINTSKLSSGDQNSFNRDNSYMPNYHNHKDQYQAQQQQQRQQLQQHGFINNNNNKISQYLLNNTSSGHRNIHSNNVSNNMQLNSLQPSDFIPHHHTQHQILQKQQKLLLQSTTNGSGLNSNNSNNDSNNISFIPDLGFSAPQNQFISMAKRNYQRK